MALLVCCNICLGLLLNSKLIRNLLFHFLFLSALFILPYLGFWQLDRLEWKNELLSNINSRQNADLIDFPYDKDTKEYEFRNSTVEGNFLRDTQTFFFRSNLSGSSGYNIINAFKTVDENIIYVDIGWISFKQKENKKYIDIDYDKKYIFSGILISSKEKNLFSPIHDFKKNIWYTMSIVDMNQFHKLNGSFYILKIIDQDYFDQTLIEFNPTQIPNNHLQYAGTWFLLFLVIGFLYFYQLFQLIRTKWNI